MGLIEGISDGLAGAGRFVGGALADDPRRRRAVAVGGYTTTAVLSSLIGVTSTVVQAGLLRGASWAARGLRVPARNALLADVVPRAAYGRLRLRTHHGQPRRHRRVALSASCEGPRLSVGYDRSRRTGDFDVREIRPQAAAGGANEDLELAG